MFYAGCYSLACNQVFTIAGIALYGCLDHCPVVLLCSLSFHTIGLPQTLGLPEIIITIMYTTVFEM